VQTNAIDKDETDIQSLKKAGQFVIDIFVNRDCLDDLPRRKCGPYDEVLVVQELTHSISYLLVGVIVD